MRLTVREVMTLLKKENPDAPVVIKAEKFTVDSLDRILPDLTEVNEVFISSVKGTMDGNVVLE